MYPPKTPIVKEFNFRGNVYTLIYDDCLNEFEKFKNIDCVIADPPYGTTACKWDTIIPFKLMWDGLDKCCKKNAAILLTGSQPFSSALVMSNPTMFRHEWIWIKNRGSNFANTVREPMKEHEQVLMFSQGKWTYNKQMQERTGGGIERAKYKVNYPSREREGTRQFGDRSKDEQSELRVPSSWQKFNCEVGLHPTQKPVSLMLYLVKTYSNEGETILDFTMGSGTTIEACMIGNRSCIGIDNDYEHFLTSVDRIERVMARLSTPKTIMDVLL